MYFFGTFPMRILWISASMMAGTYEKANVIMDAQSNVEVISIKIV
jgi:hypothetical protein